MKTTYILFGGNVGDVRSAFRYALEELVDKNVLQRTSSIYKTSPWGKTDQADFLNMVAEVKTSMSPELMMEFLHEIEKKAGRVRFEKFGPRVLDLDLLFYGDLIQKGKLEVPHPRLHERKFALYPLNELSPGLIHPEIKKSINLLLSECTDQGTVVKDDKPL